MKTSKEVREFIRSLVKKYQNLQSVKPEDVDADMVRYANPLDIAYTLSHEAREDIIQSLTKEHNSQYVPLAGALIKCIAMHPDIKGAFVTGSHANPYMAELNTTVIQLIGHASNLIEVLEAHPEFTL